MMWPVHPHPLHKAWRHARTRKLTLAAWIAGVRTMVRSSARGIRRDGEVIAAGRSLG